MDVVNQQTTGWKFWLLKLKEFYKECRRVLVVTRKPNRDEFKLIVKISGFGILAIGAIGFLIHFIKTVIERGGLS
ncbi:protein translocase SEC61 complex subunit gamma [Candidatus Woesearchaeota archaeon]|nr:protein translocase SEC61 complex subunit gamma [Candidatus Woesearchaeota archaeon]